MKLNAQEGAEMEGFVMKDVSVNVLMDSTDLTVRRVKTASLACSLMKWVSHRSPACICNTSPEIIFLVTL